MKISCFIFDPTRNGIRPDRDGYRSELKYYHASEEIAMLFKGKGKSYLDLINAKSSNIDLGTPLFVLTTHNNIKLTTRFLGVDDDRILSYAHLDLSELNEGDLIDSAKDGYLVSQYIDGRIVIFVFDGCREIMPSIYQSYKKGLFENELNLIAPPR